MTVDISKDAVTARKLSTPQTIKLYLQLEAKTGGRKMMEITGLFFTQLPPNGLSVVRLRVGFYSVLPLKGYK